MTQYITLAVDISESSAMNQYTTDAMVKERAEQPRATFIHYGARGAVLEHWVDCDESWLQRHRKVYGGEGLPL
jgi:hypothetical protein